MNIGRIIGYTCDGAAYCVGCTRETAARYSACDADGAEFDGGHGWHGCGANDSSGSPCHTIAAEGEEPNPFRTDELESDSPLTSCGGCGASYDSEWGGWVLPEEDASV